MLANRIGGAGDTLDNLFTGTQNPANSPGMRHRTGVVYDAVNHDEKIVTYNVYLGYADELSDSVPKRIRIEAYDHHGNLFFVEDLTSPAHDQRRRHRLGLLA